MKPYHQITAAERYTLMVLQVQGHCPAAIARALDRHRSSITQSWRATPLATTAITAPSSPIGTPEAGARARGATAASA